MTQLQFITHFTDITNDLLSAGITSCNIHQARQHIDYLFDIFEENEGITSSALLDESESLGDFDVL